MSGINNNPKHMAPEDVLESIRRNVQEFAKNNQGLSIDLDNVGQISISECVNNCTPKSSKVAQHEMRLEEHGKICDYLHDLYDRKNRDYGSSVTDTFNKYGLVSFLVRLEDKLNRVRSLTQNGEARVLDEKIEDTLMDMANYAMLAVIELRMQNK